MLYDRRISSRCPQTRHQPYVGRWLCALLQLIAFGPGAGLVLCVARDGHAAIEVAAPGSGRCGDFADEARLGTEEHRCDDIPLAAPACQVRSTRGAEHARPTSLAALPVTPPPPAPSIHVHLHAGDSPPPHLAHRALRTVVLLR